MTEAELVQPPRVAVWLVALFTRAEQAESILGDLLEEFSQATSKSGVAFARRWYWRQAVKTIAHLIGAGFRAAPWSIVAAAVAGFFLLRFGLFIYGQAFEAVVDRFRLYAYLSDLGRQQPSVNVGAAYMFWITRGMLIGRVVVEMLVGGIVAAAAKEREMPATMALGLFLSVLGAAGGLMMVAKTGDYGFLFLWVLPSVFTDAIAIVVGGAIVRLRRSAATTRLSAT
jgi:hypothetical protein